MQLRRRIFATPIALAATILIAAACGSSNSSSTSPSSSQAGNTGSNGKAANATLTKVTFRTDFIPSGGYAPFLYGLEKGYFKDEGIDLNLQYGSGSSTTASALAAGKADLGIVSGYVLPQAISKGAPITGIGIYIGQADNGFFVPKSSKITSIKDFVGKTIVIPSGTTNQAIMPAVFALSGVKPSSVKQLDVGFNTVYSSYFTGKGQILSAPLGDANDIVQSSLPSNFINVSSIGLKEPFGSYLVAYNPFLKSHPEVVADFLKALYRSMAAAEADPAAAVAASAANSAFAGMGKSTILSQWKAVIPAICTPGNIAHHDPVGFPRPDEASASLVQLKKYLGVSASVTAAKMQTTKFFQAPYNVSSVKCSAGGG